MYLNTAVVAFGSEVNIVVKKCIFLCLFTFRVKKKNIYIYIYIYI